MPFASSGTDEGQRRVQSAPSLPKPLRYSGSSMQDRGDLVRAYDTCHRALCVFVTPYSHQIIVPVTSCIEDRTCRMIYTFELRKNSADISEGAWITYFKQALVFEHQDYSAVEEVMRRLRFDLPLADPSSHMGRLRATMHAILNEHNVESIVLEREQNVCGVHGVSVATG